MNERIRHHEVRVVDDDGTQLGVIATREALSIARSKGLDLIEVAPQAQPPVCKIMDYGKFKYEQAKRERESAKKHKQSELKGIKMFPHIDDHDFDIKVKSAVKFLADGDKVKVTIAFKGREITHPEFGRMQMDKIIAAANEVGAQIEKPPGMEGRQMIMILSPKSTTGPAKPVSKPVVTKQPKGTAPNEAAPRNGAASTNGAALAANAPAPPAASAEQEPAPEQAPAA